VAKGDARGNLRNTRTQINNAATSAQARAFKARQLAQQQRAAEERKLHAAIAARAKADVAKRTPEPENAPETPGEEGETPDE
jgi:hypothetical protein